MTDIKQKLEQLNIDSAYDLLKQLDSNEPPIDPFGIARELNIRIDESLPWSKLGDAGEICVKHNAPVIWINSADPLTRQRFTMAHEFGHLFFDIIP